MYCIQVDIPNSLCEIDRRIEGYLSQQRLPFVFGCFNSREERNNFVEETAGMLKAERESHYEKNYSMKVTK